ncbi:MAG: VWA-like domain-containing protein [Sulfuricurvum sp.]|nr:VWA-like domain-containing protein [Sulfuricurvum sp.]MDD5386079.1 VWA-like domain-containing protein [Sulfuricurvum sp.]
MLDFSRVKSKLLVEHPYFGTLSSGLEIVVNDNIESFILHGNCFEYREDFFNTLSDEQVAFSLSNAALHTVLSHPLRIGNRSPWLWYTACDHAINNMLIDNDFVPPSKITYDPRFRGQYAEEIYEELLDTITREDLNDKDNDLRRNNEIPPDKLEAAQTEILSQNALQKGSEMGSLPEGLERLIPISLKGLIDWRSVLRDAIGGYYVSDYAMMPPSKKLLYAGIYLPSATSRHLELVIGIDSSGSVDEVVLAQFIAEVESITELFGSYSIELLVCDDRVRSHQRFTNGENIEYTLEGGGGTDFTPVFEFIDRQLTPPKMLLYFTDLDGKFPMREPHYETVWITPVMRDVPFGRVIEIKDKSVL